MTQSSLRWQVGGLVRRGYVAATFNEAILDTPPHHCFAVTFDDGKRGVIEHAFPVLAELGVRGTVFVTVGPVGMPGLLDWEDLAALVAAGWEIGSHTVTHARLTELDDAALDEELRRSRSEIEERLRRPCRSIAYPYGAFDERVSAAAAAAGYTAGCSTAGTHGSDRLSWPRVGVDGNDSPMLFRLKTSRFSRTVRGTRLGPPLEQACRVLRPG